MRLLLALIPGVLCAASSSITVTGLTVAPQPDRPLTLHRVFKEGQYPNFAKPSISGVVPDIWQNDVKSRWRDVTASRAVTGATDAIPIRITSTAHGFMEGEIVTCSAIGGNTAANATFTIRNVSANGFDLVNSDGSGTYTSGGDCNGPAAGSLKSTLITLITDVPASPGTIVVDFADDPNQCSSGNTAACNAAALDEAGMLAFNGGTWEGILETTASAIPHSASARTMIDAGHFTYWQRGPAATVVKAEDASTARAYDFGYTCATLCFNGSGITGTTGNGVNPIVVTTAVAPDLQAGEIVWILNVSGNTSTNGAGTVGTVTGTTFELTGKTGNGTYSGPNFGRIWRTYNLSTWTDDITNRSLHPIFIVGFFAGVAGVKIEPILENVWSTAAQDQAYELSLQTSAGEVFNAPLVTQYGFTRWRREIWDGDEPGGEGNYRAGVKIDYNLEYLIETKIIPPYDTTMHPTTGITDWKNAYDSATPVGMEGLLCSSTTRCGNILLGLGETGDRGDVGPITGWDVGYLYTYDPDLRVAIEGNSNNTGLMPMHIRESAEGKLPYNQAGTVPSFGMGISMDSRKTLSLQNIFEAKSYQGSGTSVGDRITPIGYNSSSNPNPLSWANRWTIDVSHFPNTNMVAYLTTGDWWHWSEMSYQSTLTIGWVQADSSVPRGKIMGLPTTAATRATAWSARTTMIGAMMAPDGTPEQDYFQQKFQNWLAFLDGNMKNTQSRYYWPPVTSPFNKQTETSPWGYGYGFVRGLLSTSGFPNPLALDPGFGECNDLAGLNTSVIPSTTYCGRVFMWNFVHMVMHWAQRAGYPVTAIRTAMAPFVVQQMQDPAACNFCTTSYNTGTKPGNLVSPTLSEPGINTTVTTIPMNSIPASWQAATPPFLLQIGSELIRICSIDVGALTATACPAGANGNNGRAFNGTSGSHSSGAPVLSFEYFTTWADQVTSFTLPWNTDWSWTGGIGGSQALATQAIAAGYASFTSGGYSGLTAYNILEAAFLTNSDGQVDGANQNPKFKFQPDLDSIDVPAAVSGRGGISGKGGIY